MTMICIYFYLFNHKAAYDNGICIHFYLFNNKAAYDNDLYLLLPV